MKDHILAAEYANPEHTELIYTTHNDGVHRIVRDENPSFWAHVHQRAVVCHFMADSAMVARAPKPVARPAVSASVIDITPQSTAVQDIQPSPQIATLSDDVTLAALRGRIAELEQQQRDSIDMSSYIESEIAAEFAVIAMMPDGAVDNDRRESARSVLSAEAKVRGVELESLCRSLAAARHERNARIMANRLKRLSESH